MCQVIKWQKLPLQQPRKTANVTSTLFVKSKFNLSGDDALHNHFGITPMIGLNDVKNEIFTKAETGMLANWTRDNSIRLLAFWSANRDFTSYSPGADRMYWKITNTNSGMYQEPFDYSNIMTTIFGSSYDA